MIFVILENVRLAKERVIVGRERLKVHFSIRPRRCDIWPNRDSKACAILRRDCMLLDMNCYFARYCLNISHRRGGGHVVNVFGVSLQSVASPGAQTCATNNPGIIIGGTFAASVSRNPGYLKRSARLVRVMR